jgi:predicted phosphodiesterase
MKTSSKETVSNCLNSKHIKISGNRKVAILSDIHLPYEDKSALTHALKLVKQFNPDVIVLNGDILDCISLSRYSRASDERDFNSELKAGRVFLTGLRKQFPKSRIIYRIGNHEARIQAFLMFKANELSTLEELSLPSLLHFKELNIEFLDKTQILDICGLKVLHGHEVAGTLAVYPARGLQLATQCPAICGHSHRSSFFISRNIERKIVQSWTSGCLCNLQPNFSVNNNWVHGIVLVTTHGQDKFDVKLENF